MSIDVTKMPKLGFGLMRLPEKDGEIDCRDCYGSSWHFADRTKGSDGANYHVDSRCFANRFGRFGLDIERYSVRRLKDFDRDCLAGVWLAGGRSGSIYCVDMLIYRCDMVDLRAMAYSSRSLFMRYGNFSVRATRFIAPDRLVSFISPA